jgi:hypothetical protein
MVPIDEDLDVFYQVESDKAVFFFHGWMHDGELLLDDSPTKRIFRSMIYYQRDPETAPKWVVRVVLGDSKDSRERNHLTTSGLPLEGNHFQACHGQILNPRYTDSGLQSTQRYSS